MDISLQRRALKRLLIALIVLTSLLLIGTAGYRFLEGMALIDALYMAVITISTVGFGEIKSLSPAGRVFTMGLIMGGGGLAAYTLSNVAAFFVGGEWREQWEQQRRLRMLGQLKNHIIVCGYGRVGRHVAHDLKLEGLPFVVIDPDLDKIAHIQAAGYLGFQGNGANEQHLHAVGIERARGLVVAAASDAENVFIVLTARSLRTDLLIIARANYDESESKLLRAGANRVILPYTITGRRMVTLLVRPDVADFLDEVAHVGNLELLLEQIRIAPTSLLVGRTLAQLESQHQIDITVLAARLPDGSLNTRPNGNTVLQSQVQIVALGTREQLQAFMTLAQR